MIDIPLISYSHRYPISPLMLGFIHCFPYLQNIFTKRLQFAALRSERQQFADHRGIFGEADATQLRPGRLHHATQLAAIEAQTRIHLGSCGPRREKWRFEIHVTLGFTARLGHLWCFFRDTNGKWPSQRWWTYWNGDFPELPYVEFLG